MHKKIHKTSMQYRIDSAGIKTIRNKKGVFLKYGNKMIVRPENVENCPNKCLVHFKIKI